MTESEFEKDRRERIARIMKMHEKPPLEPKRGGYTPLSKKEIGWFKKMGSIVTITCNGHSYEDKSKSPTEVSNTQQSLF